MKTVKFSVTEDQFTFLKHEIGFDNLEKLFQPVIEQAMEKDNHEGARR